MKIKLLAVLALVALGACSTAEPSWAPDEAVAAARFSGPHLIGHTVHGYLHPQRIWGPLGLLINASQQVMFDPAGTWKSPSFARAQ